MSPKSRKNKFRNQPSAKSPKHFMLSARMRSMLPAGERDKANDYLWKKSSGQCALCGKALDPADADPDHTLAVASGGKHNLSNLYLAHKTCNQARGDLPFELAQPLVAFRVYCEDNRTVTFDRVLDYLLDQAKARLPVKYQRTGNLVVLNCDGIELTATVFEDPATSVEYFFSELPVSCIRNDVQIQPRLISYSHVRALALDFSVRPVHEPSNCRLVLSTHRSAELLQFDGQHKTTAQMLLRRARVPVKVYIDPPIPMVQELVLKIQQEIKKQPLTRSDTLAKLGDVIRQRLDQYTERKGKVRTEVGFIAAQPSPERKAVKRQYFMELQRLVYFDPENRLTKMVQPGIANRPTTDKVVVDRVIRPLIHSQLLDSDMDEAGGRDTERELIVLILNTIAAKMIPKGWDAKGNDVKRRRAQNFFYQGSIGWWMGILRNALALLTLRV